MIQLPDGRSLPLAMPFVCDWEACRAISHNTISPAATQESAEGERLCFRCDFNVSDKVANWKIDLYKEYVTLPDDSWKQEVAFGALPSSLLWEELHLGNRNVDTESKV